MSQRFVLDPLVHCWNQFVSLKAGRGQQHRSDSRDWSVSGQKLSTLHLCHLIGWLVPCRNKAESCIEKNVHVHCTVTWFERISQAVIRIDLRCHGSRHLLQSWLTYEVIDVCIDRRNEEWDSQHAGLSVRMNEKHITVCLVFTQQLICEHNLVTYTWSTCTYKVQTFNYCIKNRNQFINSVCNVCYTYSVY